MGELFVQERELDQLIMDVKTFVLAMKKNVPDAVNNIRIMHDLAFLAGNGFAHHGVTADDLGTCHLSGLSLFRDLCLQFKFCRTQKFEGFPLKIL